jgi:hypothetical protein
MDWIIEHKALEKFPSVFEGHFMFVSNVAPYTHHKKS